MIEDTYSDLPPEEEDIGPQIYRPEFTGDASEYFRIWIVNVVLTIVTLGIYGAWAKVRTRRYFYANTLLDGEPFDYLADPLAILKGNLIVFGGFLAYILTQAYDPVISVFIIVAFYLIFPFLIYKSIRFRAHNSAYRNVRFRFLGTLGESYFTFLLIPLLIPFTLGLIVPYMIFRQKLFVMDNFAFGRTSFQYEGRPGYFYGTYGLALLIMMGIGFVAVMGMGILVAAIGGAADSNPYALAPAIMLVMVVAYIGFLVAAAFVQQFIFVRLANYSWHNTYVGPIQFQSTLSVGPLLWIHVTNILAIAVTFGLAIPWTKVRRTRYIIENLTVDSSDSLDYFAAATEPDEGAIGDAAADFFDFEIGL